MAPEKAADDHQNDSARHLQELRRALDELKSGKIDILEAKQVLREISAYYEPEIKEEEARQAAAVRDTVIPEEVTSPEAETAGPSATEEAQETEDEVAEAPETAETPAGMAGSVPEAVEEPAAAVEEAGETEEERLFREAVRLQRAEETEVFQGNFDVEIASPVDAASLREFQKHLKMVPGIKILMVSGSENGGAAITVSAGAPVTLMSFIRDMPAVSQANKTGSLIQVVLKNRQ